MFSILSRFNGKNSEPERQYRFERKYYIGPKEAALLKQRISWILSPDKHSQGGAYHISSLYFDDVHNTSLYQKQNGVLVRNKIRIRHYNGSLDFIRLEHKHKNGEMISKKSVPVSREQYEAIKNEDYNFVVAEDNPLWRMFYTRCKTMALAPVVTVDYARTVFVYAPGNVRICFDEDVRASLPYSKVSLPALPPQHMILEVKYDHFLPAVVASLLTGIQLTQVAISKYTLCRESLTNAVFYTA